LYLKYSLWLDTKLMFSFKKNEPNNTMIEGRGRLKKPFQESCEKTKKRKVQHLSDSHSSQELAFASRLSLHRSGKWHDLSVIQEVTEKTPTRAHKFKKAYKMSMRKSNNNKKNVFSRRSIGYSCRFKLDQTTIYDITPTTKRERSVCFSFLRCYKKCKKGMLST